MSTFASVYPPVMRCFNALGIDRWRRALATGATGDVLEVGCGPGFQRRFLRADAQVTAVEPDPDLRARARQLDYVDVLDAVAEQLPFPPASFDHVVISMVLCTAPDPTSALREVRRVLRPGGELHLFEHVTSNRARLRSFQRVISPVWRTLGGGCELCRDPRAALTAAGFTYVVVRRGFGGTLLLLRAAPLD